MIQMKQWPTRGAMALPMGNLNWRWSTHGHWKSLTLTQCIIAIGPRLSGKDTIKSLDGNDTIMQAMAMTSFQRAIAASTGHDDIHADQGNDTVTGGSGDDTNNALDPTTGRFSTTVTQP